MKTGELRRYRPTRRGAVATRLAAIFLSVIGLGIVIAVAGNAGIVPVVKASQGVCTVLSNAGIKCRLGNLPSGASATIQVAVPATFPGTIVDTVSVKADQPDPDVKDNTDTEQTTVLGKVDLAVTKLVAPQESVVGKPITYTITVTNNGPSPATGVTVTDKLPSNVMSVRCSDDCSITRVGDALTWRIGNLASGASVTLTCTLVPTVVGQLTNTVEVTGNEYDPELGNNIASATSTVRAPSANLSVTKSDDRDPVYVGDTVIYTITVTNTGPDDATGVELTDAISVR